MKKILLFLLILSPVLIQAQNTERAAVVKTIQTMFDAMRAGDSTTLRAVFEPGAKMMTTFYDKEGKPQLRNGSLDRFVTAVGTPHDKVWDERIWGYDVQIDQTMATVWTPYSFFAGEDFSHCGVNAFQLYKSADGWKVTHIMDTRQQEGCQMEANGTQRELERIVSSWHQAATDADEDIYFGLMTENSIFIGTDATERWSKKEFMTYAESAFKKDTAWDFKTNYRNITVADDGRQAWWDEQLDTWMGTCMATGVLLKTAEGWKITHYQLSLAVPNDKIEGFKKLVKE
ncbi:MAG: hypothetical protein Sapg2KO_24190 [Saprospiraceae bacterium]